jgi:hypothetical protein
MTKIMLFHSLFSTDPDTATGSLHLSIIILQDYLWEQDELVSKLRVRLRSV